MVYRQTQKSNLITLSLRKYYMRIEIKLPKQFAFGLYDLS